MRAGNQSRILRTSQRFGERSPELQTVRNVVTIQNARQPVEIAMLLTAGSHQAFLFVLIDIPVEAFVS